MKTAIRMALAGALLCAASSAQSQMILLTATGEVTAITDPDGFLPGSLVVEDAVSLEVTYRADDATGGPISSTQAWYQFPAGDLMITFSIDGETWRCSNAFGGTLTVVNDEPNKIIDSFGMNVRDQTGQFPFAVPNSLGFLNVGFKDAIAPLDLVQSLALPIHPGDVDFNAMTQAYGELNSVAGGSAWYIYVVFDSITMSSTVSVEESTWGAIKKLYGSDAE